MTNSEPTIVVDHVVANDFLPDGLRCAIESPVAGSTATGHLIRVQGWVLGAESVSAADLGKELVKSSEWRTRHDISTSVKCGFILDIPSLGLTTDFNVAIVAETAAGSVQLATVIGRRQLLPAESWDDDGPSPLAVTGLGRSGTTWLIHLLGQHPEIAVPPQWPREMSSSAFHATTLRRLLDRPHGLDHPQTRDLTDSGTWWTSSSPYDLPGVDEWYAGPHVEILARAMRDDMVAFACAMAGRPIRYFAEKTAPVTDTRLILELFPRAREIVLIRDFRDVVASILAFNAKRGSDAFFRQLVDSDADYVRLLAGSLRAMQAHTERNPAALVVKYEDLVGDSGPTLQRILSHLRLPDSAADAATLLTAPDTDDLQHHRTSQSPAESIGRWRTDLPPDLQYVAEQEYRPTLDFFDYA